MSEEIKVISWHFIITKINPVSPVIFASTLKIKKICFSPEVPIQPCRPKSDSAPPGAIWARFKPKQLNQKAIPAHDGAQPLGPNHSKVIGCIGPDLREPN